MVILRRQKITLTFMSVVWRFVNFDSGQFWMTSATAAQKAGECCEKTIDRDIKKLAKVGLVIVKIDRVKEKGKWVTHRFGRLSLPEKIPNGIKVDDVWKDYRCPSEDQLWMDHANPKTPDNRGPLTPEATPEEEERGDAE